MTGNVYPKNGTLYAVLHYKDKDRKKKFKWIPTGLDVKGNMKKAKAMIPGFIEQWQHLEYKKADEQKPLLTEAVKQWLESKKGKLERSTYESQTIYVNKHIIPYFEKLNLTLEDVTPKHIRDYYEYKFRNGRLDGKPGGLDIQSIRKHSMVLKQVFTEALIAEQIMRNPASAVPLPKQDKQEIKGVFLTGDEANKLLQVFSGHQLQAMVYVTLYYGLRRSEALGLKWSAVNFEENTITMDCQVLIGQKR
jgi:integrase